MGFRLIFYILDKYIYAYYILYNNKYNFTDGASNEKWSRYLKSSDFRSLCRQGPDTSRNIKTNPCYLSWTPQASVMVRQKNTQWRKEEIRNVLGTLDSLFGKYYKAHTPSFALYSPFDTKGDIIFHGTTAKLVTFQDVLRDRHSNNYEFVNKNLLCSSKVSRTTKNLSNYSLIAMLLVFTHSLFM